MARFYALHVDELCAGRRTLFRTWARHATCHLLRSTGRYSHSDIARILKYKNHSSVISALHRIKRAAATDPVLAGQLRTLRAAWVTRETELYTSEKRD